MPLLDVQTTGLQPSGAQASRTGVPPLGRSSPAATHFPSNRVAAATKAPGGSFWPPRNEVFKTKYRVAFVADAEADPPTMAAHVERIASDTHVQFRTCFLLQENTKAARSNWDLDGAEPGLMRRRGQSGAIPPPIQPLCSIENGSAGYLRTRVGEQQQTERLEPVYYIMDRV
jgi:hypothetical protein